MQLPFTVVIEPPSPAKLRYAGRTWWTWAIALGITASSVSGVAIYRLEAQRGMKVASAAL